MSNALMNSLLPETNANFPQLKPGDTVRVHQRITEGRNERIQVFQGVVIAMRGGKSAGATYTVRRTAAHGIGVERTFPLYSKTVDKVEVLRNAKVRQAQLYYLRERSGKSARLKEKRFIKS
ncbi:MAG: 50S ribosomal protein L19 [Caldilineaceae bacterium]|nr:50S ribosomal protein L19 [Caldilineaceae bacterium]